MCSIEKRLAEGLFWETDKPPKMPLIQKILVSLAFSLLVLIGIVLTLAYLHKEQLEQNQSLKVKVSQLEKSSMGYSGLLASCLNGHTLIDTAKGIALFTEKAIVIDVNPIGKKL